MLKLGELFKMIRDCKPKPDEIAMSPDRSEEFVALSRQRFEFPVQFAGIPVVVDDTLAPGTVQVRINDTSFAQNSP